MSGWGAARKVNLKVQEGHRVDSDGIQWLLIKQFCPKSKQFEVWSDDWVHQIQPAGKYNLLQNNHDHHIRNNEFEYKIIINSCTALLRAEARKSLPSREALWKDSRLSSTPAIRGPLHTEKIIASRPVTKLMISSNGRPRLIIPWSCLSFSVLKSHCPRGWTGLIPGPQDVVRLRSGTRWWYQDLRTYQSKSIKYSLRFLVTKLIKPIFNENGSC